MIIIFILSLIISVTCNTEKIFVSSTTKFPLVANQTDVGNLSLSFPYKRINFKGVFKSRIELYYILNLDDLKKHYGEVRLCWAATIPLLVDFSFLKIKENKVLKLTLTHIGVEWEPITSHDLEFTLISEQLLLRAIPISFIPVLLEILSTFILAWLLYPTVINFIDNKSNKSD